MCTNYRRRKGVADMIDDFSHIRLPLVFEPPGSLPNLEPQSEIRPTDRAVVFRAKGDGVELARLRWGLIPWFHRGTAKQWKHATFNARAETVAIAPSFRDVFARRRCLIAAEGFVEWKGEGTPKPKFYIDRRDGAPICFAGLWDRCVTTDAGVVESFTMVTQPPGALSDVHDRAPVILRQCEWRRWLDPEADSSDLLTAAPPDEFRVRSFADAG